MGGPQDERGLLDGLRAGNDDAFRQLVDTYHASMVRVARAYVSTRASAEEVVQEAWLGVLKGLEAFEGRSSLKTWIFRILTNIAKTRGQKEGRTVPFSSLEPDEPAVDPRRFNPADQPHAPGAWSDPPRSWSSIPERVLLSNETQRVIAEAIDAIPESQRLVITMRDVDGLSSEDVCNVLQISETNQRVLLHRARARVRGVLERYLEEEPAR